MSRLLGLTWNTWVRIAAASWILLFAAAWVSLPLAWMNRSEGADILTVGSFIAVILAHAVPGIGALVYPHARARLRREPGAAALSSMTLAAIAGIACFIGATTTHDQQRRPVRHEGDEHAREQRAERRRRESHTALRPEARTTFGSGVALDARNVGSTLASLGRAPT